MVDYPLQEPSRALPWQQASWDQLQLAVENRRLPHALLLTGTPGSERNAFALALARALLCTSPTAEGNCGTCKSCELSRQGVHADLRVVGPAEPGKAIGIDSIRALNQFATQTSNFGECKLIVVSPLESLTTSAFNAFLKILEEPADNTYFLLVHARGRRVPATIRSRCQTIALAAPTPDAALEWLTQSLDGESAASAEARLAVAGGSPGLALAQARDGSFDALHTLLQALQQTRGRADMPQLIAAGEAVGVPQLLGQLECELRSRAGSLAETNARVQLCDVLEAEASVASLHRAFLSGSNPNPELLRFTALDAFAAACEASERGGKLRAT